MDNVKPQQLRIGNIILDDLQTPRVVTALSSNFIEVDMNGQYVTVFHPQSIPLDYEWLTRSGYGRNITGDAWWDNYDDILIGEDEDGKFYLAQWDENNLVQHLLEIRSLDHFQNLVEDFTERELRISL